MVPASGFSCGDPVWRPWVVETGLFRGEECTYSRGQRPGDDPFQTAEKTLFTCQPVGIPRLLDGFTHSTSIYELSPRGALMSAELDARAL